MGNALLDPNHKGMEKCNYNMKWNRKEPEIASELQ